ncbi:MAG: PilC/PilY family type IV pilus protein, partial [Halieaceae bacterium]|nr:PilC/PilY family type IV pilus protein [Halieaceae bacterium]
MKLVLTIALYGVLAGLIATRPKADDIDIYLSGSVGAADTRCEGTTATDTGGALPGSLVAGSVAPGGSGKGASGQAVYYALFQPEPWPLWSGNIKKLKIAPLAATGADPAESAQWEIVAAAPAGRTAISTADGQILPEALTFWTDPLGADVLAFDPDRQEVPGRDGRSVTRGGAGQQVPGLLANEVGTSNAEPGARQIFTPDPARPGELLPFDASAASFDLVAPYLDPAGVLSGADGLDLMRWIRGQDSYDEDADGDRYESRRWLLGDVLHSKPLAIDYGARRGSGYSAGNPDIRIFFGSNDGVFHQLRNTSPAGAESGRESWAFLPLESLGMQATLAHKQVSAQQAHPYGLDGEAVAVIEDRNGDGTIEGEDGDSVLVVIGQRRGGRGLYAFDMTDPDSPRYRWSIDHRTPGFEQLALTFSTPRVARLDLGEDTPTTVLLFGGGYNGGWAGSDRVGKDAGAGSDPIGNAIYVVNPADGSLVWRAVGPGDGGVTVSGEGIFYAQGLTDSIPSALAVIDTDHNGVDDRAYVGDSGGNVWRIELTEHRRARPGTATTDAANWSLERLASLGAAGAGDRRFFHAPDVVQSRDVAGDYVGVLIVSGNRASPLEQQAHNFAYLLKDRKTAATGDEGAYPGGSVIGHEDLADVTGDCLSPAQESCVAADLIAGWKLAMQAPGEKGLSTPLLSNGTAFFTTYVPVAPGAPGDSPPDCAESAGVSRVYGVTLGSGLPALPPPGELTFADRNDTPVERRDRFRRIGPGLPADVLPFYEHVLIPAAGLGDATPVRVPGRSRWRTWWREEEVDTL